MCRCLYAAGARMATCWPLSNTEHGVGLNITVMSYTGKMGFGAANARSAALDPRGLTQARAERLRVFRSCPRITPKDAQSSLQMLAIAR